MPHLAPPPHIPVLLNAVKSAFSSVGAGTLIDCTLGYGGHSAALLNDHPNLNIIALDRDITAINYCQKRFKNEPRIAIHHQKFSDFKDRLSGKIAGILADIGVSSLQLDLNERGFSLNSDELDMRMDKTAALDAKMVVNEYPQSELERIFKEYGELKNYKSLAAKIVQKRALSPIKSNKELFKICTGRVAGRSLDAAILAFQAIRIEVNDELGELKSLLSGIKSLAQNPSNADLKGAIICIITFHSLEDRIVKEAFKSWAKACICDEGTIKCTCSKDHAIGTILTKKPITADAEELKLNPRATCAKLRVFKLHQ